MSNAVTGVSHTGMMVTIIDEAALKKKSWNIKWR